MYSLQAGQILLPMPNQTAYQQYANGAGDAGDYHGNGSQIVEKQVILLMPSLLFPSRLD